MPTYVYRDGIMVDKHTGAPMLSDEERNLPLQAPHGFSDFGGYQSPITGDWIDGRRARRYDLEKNDCVPAQDLKPYGYKGKKLTNRRFIQKHGLQDLSEQ